MQSGALSIQPTIPEILVGTSNGTDHFHLVQPESSRPALKVVLLDRSGHFGRLDRKVLFCLTKLLSPVPLFCILDQMHGGLGWVCATGMSCSIGHIIEFSKFQTRIFVKWKAPLVKTALVHLIKTIS